MELTYLLAQVIGLTYLVVGLGFFLNRGVYRRLFEDMLGHPPTIFWGGMLSLVVGLLMVLHHNVWEMSYVGLVTLFGWLATVKGALLLLAPEAMMSWSKRMIHATGYWLSMVVAILVGAYLTYVGFFM